MATVTVDELLARAREAAAQAYCPYSGYHVGAALVTDDGQVFSGCNVENAAYPEGTCAEAGAIAAMVLAGRRRIATIVTVTDGAEPGSPCGGCRQKIREFGGPATEIHSFGQGAASLRFTLAELLPGAFGPEYLQQET